VCPASRLLGGVNVWYNHDEMRTPFGQECRHYYEDFHRGRSIQECRLVEQTPSARDWSANLCRQCPVPGILRANGCSYLQLQGHVAKGFLGFGRRMEITATCSRSNSVVDEPYVGCGQCHLDSPAASLFGED
jgi:hypothetical protein